MFICKHSSHYCFLTVNNFVCFRAKIRKLSFKRKRFLVKLHPEIFVSTYSIIYIMLLTNPLFVYLMATILAVMAIRKNIPYLCLAVMYQAFDFYHSQTSPLRDGPLEKLWGGGGGEFSSRRNFLVIKFLV